MQSQLIRCRSKIVSQLPDAKRMVDAWQGAGLEVVFTNGCFDLVHDGHLHYLAQARDLGDRLVIGLNSDASVKRLKGSSRPIVPERSRALLLASLQFVDLVVFFDEDTPLKLIETLNPDVLVKGGDYTRDTVVGADWVEAHGGKVLTLPYIDGLSTTSLINKIKQM